MTKELPLIVETGSDDELEAELAGRAASAAELAEAIHVAARLGRVSAIRALVAAGGSVDAASEQAAWTPLHTAVEHGQVDVIQELVALGADPNSRAREGMTPLHLAVDAAVDAAEQMGTADGLSVVRRLLELGANPAVKDDAGSSPRDWAEDADSAALSELLA